MSMIKITKLTQLNMKSLYEIEKHFPWTAADWQHFFTDRLSHLLVQAHVPQRNLTRRLDIMLLQAFDHGLRTGRSKSR